jgi:hypothetical protein
MVAMMAVQMVALMEIAKVEKKVDLLDMLKAEMLECLKELHLVDGLGL